MLPIRASSPCVSGISNGGGGSVLGMANNPKEETYCEEETERRREAALKRMLATPHKPHEKQKKGAQARPAKKGSR